MTSSNRQKSRLRANRKLHLGHIAFMRAVVQGIDTYESWNRYLRIEGEHQDRKLVHRTVQWIRDEFAAAARRHARPGTARLVRIDPNRSELRQPKVPTLEEFASDHGLTEFSEAEQLEHFIARYGRQSTRQTRRGRLIEKQLAALDWLEQLIAEPPNANDPVDAWLHPDLAAHLRSVRIRTLKQLAERINGLGKKWSTGIPAIGKTKAERIVDWLRVHAPSTGLLIGEHTDSPLKSVERIKLAKVVAPATAIVPLDKLIIPEDLDGRHGKNRRPQAECKISAEHDLDAIVLWLSSKNGGGPFSLSRLFSGKPDAMHMPTGTLRNEPLKHTQRAYWKEAERFLLWAVITRKIALSSIDAQDCAAYVAFLENPIPREQWCGPRSRERWSPLWRPFEGPLAPSARRQSVVILKNLYRFMVDNHYLANDPWRDIRLPGRETTDVRSRSFSMEQWGVLEQQLQLLSNTSAHRRLRIALHLFYETGLPLHKVLNARVGQLRIPASANEKQHVTQCSGDPGEESEHPGAQAGIVLSFRLAKELSEYLESRGLHPDITHPSNQQVYVLGKATDIVQRAPWSPEGIRNPDNAAGITANTLYLQIKAFLKNCAQAIAQRDAEAAKQFAAASVRWLRRTHDVP